MAFNNRFGRLKKKIGKKLCMYALRHSYAHHALTKGKVDAMTTATLMGHANTHMLMQTYGHLLKDQSFHVRGGKEGQTRCFSFKERGKESKYHRLNTLCINHTQGDSFSTLSWHQCAGLGFSSPACSI